jgi:hypothetical protein
VRHENRLERFPQVKSVETDPLTGSVRMHHSGSAFDLLLAAAGEGLGELIEFEPPAPVARQLQAEVALFDDIVKRLSAGQLDLNTLAMFGFFALAGIQLCRGNQPVIAVTLAWYASELLRRWEDPAADEIRRPG